MCARIVLAAVRDPKAIVSGITEPISPEPPIERNCVGSFARICASQRAKVLGETFIFCDKEQATRLTSSPRWPLRFAPTMYVLNNWTIVLVPTPSGASVMRLFGEVFGHPRYEAGQKVTVSALASYQIMDDSLSVITRSESVYVLGKPDPAERDAMVRVFQYLQGLGASTAAPTQSVASDPDGALDGATTRTR
jgi:hypothetical protein